MVESGIKDIFLSNEIVDKRKLERFIQLAEKGKGSDQNASLVRDAQIHKTIYWASDNCAELQKILIQPPKSTLGLQEQ